MYDKMPVHAQSILIFDLRLCLTRSRNLCVSRCTLSQPVSKRRYDLLLFTFILLIYSNQAFVSLSIQTYKNVQCKHTLIYVIY